MSSSSFDRIAHQTNQFTNAALKIRFKKIETKQAIERTFILGFIIFAMWLVGWINKNIWMKSVFITIAICCLINILHATILICQLVFAKRPLYGNERQLAKCIDTDDFTYHGSMGPEHWGEDFSECKGKYQSPINILSNEVQQKFFPKLIMSRILEVPLSGTVTNNGHTAVIQYEYANDPPDVTGGPLYNDTYSFVQMHFHWGRNSMEGSEDRLDNRTYPAELHVVWRNTKYPSYVEAIKHSDGLAVFAYFIGLDRNGTDNPTYSEIVYSLEKIRHPGSHFTLLRPMHMFGLIDISKAYFTYQGSLTTPPCSEDVIWIDFDERIRMSERQIDNFRHLLGPDGKPLNHNFRPTQPLNNRVIYLHAYDEDEELELGHSIPFINNLATATNIHSIGNTLLAALSFILALRQTVIN